MNKPRQLVTLILYIHTDSGTGPFTVFAPNEDAFANVPSDVLEDLLANVGELTGNYFPNRALNSKPTFILKSVSSIVFHIPQKN